MTLTLIMCMVCGRPTGGVVDPNEYDSLSQEQQTCSDCHGVDLSPARVGTVTSCHNCGNTTFDVSYSVQQEQSGVTIETREDEAFFNCDNPGRNVARTRVICNNCREPFGPENWDYVNFPPTINH